MKEIIHKNVEKILSHIKGINRKVKSTFFMSPQKKIFSKWFKDDGDNTHRLNYDLNNTSVVFDVGGYKGQWAGEIDFRFNCKIYIFEPVHEYVNSIQSRFLNNPNILVFPFGLANYSSESKIAICEDGSSTVTEGDFVEEKIFLKKASDFFIENSISHIDLMKINIEGGEYELLEHLIDTKNIQIIDNLQIQFHDNIPDAKKRMEKIQTELSKTHYLTYQYVFVWENWKIKNTIVR